MNITEELFDVLDDKGQTTGEQKARALVHRDGDWHRSFHLWIIKEGNLVLFQRRAKSKDLEPFKLDVTVGGHFRAGEQLADVVRECEEEIGLFVQPEQLTYLETRRAERVYEHAVDREFQEVYVMRCEQELDQYFLNCDEVFVLYEISLDRAINFYRHGGHVFAQGFDCYQRPNHALLLEEEMILQAREDTLEVLLKVKAWLDLA